MSNTDFTKIHAHHDDLEVDGRDINLMRSFLLWVETVRASGGYGYDANWEPTDIDIVKSRLFWRIRSGVRPLAWPPPRAYSCPWYEVVEEPGNHGTFEAHRGVRGNESKWAISQEMYDHIDTIGEFEHIVGYGNYRFRLFRDEELDRIKMKSYNPRHAEDDAYWDKYYADMKPERRATNCWFLERRKDLEISEPEFSLGGNWAKQLKSRMGE